MSNAINEIDNTDLVFVFGYNPADSHPIVANHVINAKRNGAKIIVCDPRKIETARIADMHIALKNGSNIALLNAMGMSLLKKTCTTKRLSPAVLKVLKSTARLSKAIRRSPSKRSLA
ncbi:Formate dehydrogenase H, selenocysteine-containing [Salmonella enterica subsp. enterica]|nr:Formate dehydrogenase H, selenocysteine-containing [Salmonella enterica subsp. enterica]